VTDPSLTATVFSLLKEISDSGEESPARLHHALRLLAKWRTVLIQNTLLQNNGTKVLSGVLAGMDFLPRSAEGCHIAKLLGCYEYPLQPAIAEAVQAAYPLILNIGCAEGYYAVGMARLMPGTKVLAFDLDPNARAACLGLARKNGVEGQVEIGELFRPEDFARYANERGLVLCDIEGAERDLLDPVMAPELSGMDLIVESHECLVPGITAMLRERFAATHTITQIDDLGQRPLDGPPWFTQLSHLDQLLAVWEWRAGPTPWLVMKHRA
jgi:SAM-dependent methyltransferase